VLTVAIIVYSTFGLGVWATSIVTPSVSTVESSVAGQPQ
jgi:hypothetical protein